MGIIATPQPASRPAMEGMSSEALTQVAAYFKALSEPTRLKILNLLRRRERNVSEIAEATRYTAANVSRHLTLLTKHGLVAREGRGNAVYYRIADESIYALCDLVCGNIARQFEHTARAHEAFSRTAARARRA